MWGHAPAGKITDVNQIFAFKTPRRKCFCARVRIAAGMNGMKRLLVFLTLAALSISCYTERRPQLRSVKGLSTEPATWEKSGPWMGRTGTAVTIQFKEGTEQFLRAQEVTLRFDHRAPYYHTKSAEWQVLDFRVPVMTREPHALTLFFSGEAAIGVLEQLPDQIEAGTLDVIPCVPDRVC